MLSQVVVVVGGGGGGGGCPSPRLGTDRLRQAGLLCTHLQLGQWDLEVLATQSVF